VSSSTHWTASCTDLDSTFNRTRSASCTPNWTAGDELRLLAGHVVALFPTKFQIPLDFPRLFFFGSGTLSSITASPIREGTHLAAALPSPIREGTYLAAALPSPKGTCKKAMSKKTNLFE
jgi:hypothetical protein